MSRDDETFLGRWSRRKRDETVVEPEPEQTQEAHAPLEEKSDEEMLAELDLPDPDSLTEGDDFSAFMQKAVPDRLRKRALRKLWLSNPDLANLDGLLEYGEDYTDAAMVPEVLNTAYKVGRGFLKDIVEEAEDQADDAEVALETEDKNEGDAPVDALAQTDSEINHDTSDEALIEDTEVVAAEQIPDDTQRHHQPRPRMRFSSS